MTKSTQQKEFWPRLAQIGLGLVMIAGGIWALTQPAGALSVFLTILGLMLLLRGAAGVLAYYKLRHEPDFKEKISLGIGMLLFSVGLLMLAVPGLVAPVLKWVAAAAFALTALRGLTAFINLRAKNKSLSTLSLALNLVLLAAAVLLAFNPLPAVFTLPLLLFICLICAGADLIADGIIQKK